MSVVYVFWVEAVTKAGGSGSDRSEPPPRGKEFIKVVCRMSDIMVVALRRVRVA